VLTRLAALSLLLACGAPTPALVPARERIDAHVHLVEDAAGELLGALDRRGIARAVVLASPHLDPAHPPAPGEPGFSGWRAANERLLAATAEHRGRLLPFVTLDPADADPRELDDWLSRGACGVKLYIGHQSLHARPLADPAHDAIFTALEQRSVPVLLHVNTVRFEHELAALLRAHPSLELVCAHLCGSRTDLDRLARILRDHPRLRVDTSHGGGRHGVDGFVHLERERERIRGMIAAEPQRFIFGSDLVTATTVGDRAATRHEWDQQLAANLGLLTADEFEFMRPGAHPDSLVPGKYRGLSLSDDILADVLAGNARRWLARCLR
jgi:predicted TIM-barrel fold metal-dependent hydrolase